MTVLHLTPGRTRSLAALLVCAAALAGCASAAGGPPAANGPAGSGEPAAADVLACGMTVDPGTAVLGEEVVIARPATEPGGCATLAPGSTQTLELRSSIHGLTAEQSVPVVVGADGAFQARMRIPTGIRVGDAVITAIPPAEWDCDAAVSTEECILPRTYLTVGFDPNDLAPVRITSTDLATPALPPEDLVDTPYVLAGPGPTELTLVVIGSSCATRPAQFVTDAGFDILKIVSAVEVPPGEGCDTLAVHWTTVIEIPEGYEGFTTVTVDNVAATVLTP